MDIPYNFLKRFHIRNYGHQISHISNIIKVLKGATYVICKEGKRKITNHATGSGYQKAKE